MSGAQAHLLPDGRLHLHHGPIDVLLSADGQETAAAFTRATQRFRGVLDELVPELPLLRQSRGPEPKGAIARRMYRAIAPFSTVFVTPMAAVAGAVADTLRDVAKGTGLDRLIVNNGGDVALWLAPGAQAVAAIATTPPARLTVRAGDGVGGLATSGWRGRSHSFGIADSVTVLASTAAQADVAATLIANQVNLPGHPSIERRPANALSQDSDLGARLVTVGVGRLSDQDIERALQRGSGFAESLLADGHIRAAYLTLSDQSRVVGNLSATIQKEPINA